MKQFKLGYTAGVFDLFHIGHLNIIKNAKALCDELIVAVSTDELVREYKHKTPIIPYDERKAIVEAIRHVDYVVPQERRNKIEAFKKYKFDAMFVGDDWKGSPVFEEVDKYMRARGSCVVYLPYTAGTSSTILREVMMKVCETDS